MARQFSLLLIGLAALSGCDTVLMPWEKDNIRKQAALEITCDAPEACETAWKRARRWAKNNTDYPITQQTDDIIANDPAPFGSAWPAFTIRKTASDNGSYAITLDAACHNIFGCTPNVRVLKARFNSYMQMVNPDR